MRALISVVATAALLTGCAATATPAKESTMQTSATLAPQRSMAAGAGATLLYEGANDSRCPPDVRCVVAGEITYKFTLSGSAGNESFHLSKARPVFEASTYKGVRVTLAETVEPARLPSTASLPVAMPVTINLTRP